MINSVKANQTQDNKEINNQIEQKEINENKDKNPEKNGKKGQLSVSTLSPLDGKKNKEKSEFEAIKLKKGFQKLLLKENKIQKDFHGYRDFFNLIKGIANDLANLGDSGDNVDKEKIEKIIKYIERNFGGIKYDINIDYNLKFGDMEYFI